MTKDLDFTTTFKVPKYCKFIYRDMLGQDWYTELKPTKNALGNLQVNSGKYEMAQMWFKKGDYVNQFFEAWQIEVYCKLAGYKEVEYI